MEQIGEEQPYNEEGSDKKAEPGPLPEQKQPPKVNIDDVLKKLNVMFSYYASFGDRLNVTKLKSSKYHKLLQDAGVEANIVQKKKIDLIFCSQNKNLPTMIFDVFLDSLPLIAQLKYPEVLTQLGPGEALNELLANNLLPLYDKLIITQQQLPAEQRYDIELSENAALVLKSIEDILYEIYVTYYPWEQKTSDGIALVENRSNKATFTFLNEFDICPSILSKTIVFNILTSIIHNSATPPTSCILFPNHSEVGTVLTFAKFLYVLVKAAYFAYESTGQQNTQDTPYSIAERLCMLLERMELSNGFTNLEKKTNRPHTSRTSLLPPESLITKVYFWLHKFLDFTRKRRK